MAVIKNKSAVELEEMQLEERDSASMKDLEDPTVMRGRVYKFLIGLVVSVCVSLMLLIALVWSLTSKRGYVPPPTPGAVEAAASLRSNMDMSADPCTDFYQYACGGWMKKHIIPDDTDNWSNFVILREKTSTTVYNLINSLSEKKKEDRPEYVNKVLNFYTSCTNKTGMDADGAEDTLKAKVAELLAAQTTTAALQLAAGYNTYVFYVPYVDPDGADPDKNSLFIVQGAVGMGLKEEYNANVTDNKDLEDRQGYYKSYIKQLWSNYDATKTDADTTAIVNKVYDFEFCLAEGMLTPEEERKKADSMDHLTYQEFLDNTISDGIMLEEAVKSRTSPGELPVRETITTYYIEDYIKQVKACITTQLAAPADFKLYLATRVMMKYAGSGKSSWRDIAWEYQKNRTKVEVKPPVWKSCLGLVTDYMPETVGRIFADEVFKEEAKNSTLSMIKDIKEAFIQILPDLTWMDETTREQAEEKAQHVDNKIGYPDWSIDDTKLNKYIKDITAAGSLLDNLLEADAVLIKKSFDDLSKDADKTKWYMSPATVNAYYNPKGNEMVFPAAILQPPFFHESYPTYVNYGAIGVVIGHELTHGFDDNGRKYNKNGKKEDWGTKEAGDKFEERAKCLVNQYGSYELMGYKVNGNLTLGENIADNGGVKQAYIAYQNWVSRNGEEPTLPGMDLTNEQSLFLSYAQIWCQKKTPEAFERMVAEDPHSPGRFRVKGPLINSNEFVKAFQCPPDSNMNQKEKCEVW